MRPCAISFSTSSFPRAKSDADTCTVTLFVLPVTPFTPRAASIKVVYGAQGTRKPEIFLLAEREGKDLGLRADLFPVLPGNKPVEGALLERESCPLLAELRPGDALRMCRSFSSESIDDESEILRIDVKLEM